MKEIAGKLNTSISTISRALSDKPNISQATKIKVRQLVKELNYLPDQRALSFKQKKTFTIGVVLPDLWESFFSEAISGIEEMANAAGYMVLIGQSHDDEEKERGILTMMRTHRVDGLLISISRNTANYEHFDALRKREIPVVYFDRIPRMNNIHYIACNMESGTIQAMRFLLKKGHRAIGLINGPDRLAASQERKQGYIKALLKHRLKFDPSLVISCDLTQAGTHAAMQELLSQKRKPTAVLAFNDYVAMDAIQYARSLKMKINRDITFVSYANSPMNEYMEFPPIASVEQYPYRQGQKAAGILLELLNRKEPANNSSFRQIILESQLVIPATRPQ
jgi:LacI family transcriptional regulator